MFLICALVISAANATLITVQSEPAISLSGGSGHNVSFTGAGFLPTDTTCYVSSPSSNGVILSSACVVQAGTGASYGGFTIGNVLPGEYVIQVTGNYGDFAQAIVQVNGGTSQFSMSHVASLQAGSRVSVHVTGLLPTDTTCQLSSPSSPNVILPGTAACVIQAGTGVAYGGFIMGNVLPGSYVIQVTGNQGDFAQTVLAVG
jgi:uncharacterized membrane protein (DUF485 family)